VNAVGVSKKSGKQYKMAKKQRQTMRIAKSMSEGRTRGGALRRESEVERSSEGTRHKGRMITNNDREQRQQGERGKRAKEGVESQQHGK
jgi:hypothetical protein